MGNPQGLSRLPNKPARSFASPQLRKHLLFKRATRKRKVIGFLNRGDRTRLESSPDRILFLLKTGGPLAARDLALRLGMTQVGVRQHLAALLADGLAHYSERSGGRGRPMRIWSLTQRGHERFPDRHADATVALIDQMRRVLGEAALEAVIAATAEQQLADYRVALKQARGPLDALQRLAVARTRQGYMARAVAVGDGSYRFVEDHCPICAAATACRGFCTSELAVFRQLLARFGAITREDHLMAGARRCAYRLVPKAPGKRAADGGRSR
jgi:predicted ArsR family transcriptional regulator